MTVGSTTSTGASSSSSALASIGTGQSQLNQDYTSFLTLLTTQLQNQDPLSPMDSNTFTQQLVAMNGVQQQLLTNNLLQQLVTQNTGAGSVGSAVGMIGKDVTATSSVAALQNGSASWNYTLGNNAAQASVEVLDSNNNIVWTGSAPSDAQGTNTFTWNGQTTAGGTAPAGNYTLNISATDATGAAITTTTSISGVASGVQTSNGVTQVIVGGVPVNFNNITAVQNPS